MAVGSTDGEELGLDDGLLDGEVVGASDGNEVGA